MIDLSYAILSMDGGGIRGIIPCMVLAEIEKRCKKRTAELFDLVAGTSTGGILAAGATIKGEDGRPKFSAEELGKLYSGPDGKEIFKKSGLGALRILYRAIFSEDNIERILNKNFGEARLKDAFTELLVTSYDTEQKLPFYFSSAKAKDPNKPEEDFFIRDIARATSAAPTYFPAKKLPYKGHHKGFRLENLSLIDGGVFANNPSVLAYIHGLSMWKNPYTPNYDERFDAIKIFEPAPAGRDMVAEASTDNFAAPFLLVSLGTGHTQKPYPYSKIKGWGISWLRPLIDIFMQGVSESVHYQMQYLLPSFYDENNNIQPRYYRLNIKIDKEHSDMSNVSEKNVKQLEQYGRDIIDQNAEAIDNICQLLEQIAIKRRERD